MCSEVLRCKQEKGSWSALLTALFFADYLCHAFLNDVAYHHSVLYVQHVQCGIFIQATLNTLIEAEFIPNIFFFSSLKVSIFIEENYF